MNGQDIADILRQYRWLPPSLLKLIAALLVREIRDNFPAVASHPEYESRTYSEKYAQGLRRILKREPPIIEKGDGLYAPIKDIFGISKADVIYLQDLLIYDQWYRVHREKRRNLLDQAEQLYNTMETETKKEVTQDMKRMREDFKNIKPAEPYAIRWKDKTPEECVNRLHDFWLQILTFNVSFVIPPLLRFQHTLICAATGSGKTSLLYKLIQQDIASNACVIVMTPKGNLLPALAQLVPPERLIYFSPANPIPLNVFDLDRSDSGIELIHHLFDELGAKATPRQTTLLNHCIRLLQNYPDSTLRTLQSLIKATHLPATYTTTGLSQSTQEFFRDDFSSQAYKKVKEEEVKWRIDHAIETDVAQNVFCSGASGLNMNDVMAQGKILLIDTSEGEFGAHASGLIGRFFLAAIAIAAKKRTERRPCFVYVDEAKTYVTSNIATILERAREAQVGLTLAVQQLDHLKELESTVMTNTAIKIVGRVPNDDGKFSRLIKVEPEKLRDLPFLTFYLKAFSHPIKVTVQPLTASHIKHSAPSRPIPTQSTPTPEESVSSDWFKW